MIVANNIKNFVCSCVVNRLIGRVARRSDMAKNVSSDAATANELPRRMITRPLLMVLSAALIMLGQAGHALAEQRFALVIGNSNYRLQRLTNPQNDARLIAKTLSALGFKVTTLIDADLRAMRRAMLRFSRDLRTSDAVGLFYYAGHGVQVDGVNYLIPIGANIVDESEIPVEGLSLNQMFRTMERSANRINIAILDACRNNPYASSVRGGGTSGLAPVLAPSGSFIAYATAPGMVAYDGKGRNSPYTMALSEALRNPGIAIEEVFRRTRRKVLAVTKGKQTPWESSSLTGVFYFKQKPADLEANERRARGQASGLSAQQLREVVAWRKAQDGRTGTIYKKFIEDYPSGIFAELARIKLSALQRGDAGGRVGGGGGSNGGGAGAGDGTGGANWTGAIARRSSAAKGPSTAKDLRNAKAEQLNDQALAALAKNDLAGALAKLRQAAKLGSGDAMYHLGKLYDKGRGVPRSLAISASWYRAGADLGHGAAMGALGNMYEFGEGVERHLANALRLYQMASEKDDANGMTSLAFLYATGKGVAREPQLARKWYRAAAQKGNRRAMFNLALMQIRGQGGRITYSGAANWLKKAVAKGHSGAMRQLAALHEEGKGVPKAPKIASQLLLRSFKAGNKDARTDLLVRPETWSRATRRYVQKELKRRGVYRGRTTGVFGRRTKNALLALKVKAAAR